MWYIKKLLVMVTFYLFCNWNSFTIQFFIQIQNNHSEILPYLFSHNVWIMLFHTTYSNFQSERNITLTIFQPHIEHESMYRCYRIRLKIWLLPFLNSNSSGSILCSLYYFFHPQIWWTYLKDHYVVYTLGVSSFINVFI